MSTLNSRELLLSVLVGGKLPLDALVDTGLDVELLEELVGELRPHMDYLGRLYKPLESYFEKAWYADWLKESDLAGKYQYCLALLQASLAPEHTYRGLRCWSEMDVYLTRKGEWIIWVNYPEPRGIVAPNAKEALAIVNELMPKKPAVHLNPVAPSIAMIRRLMGIFQESINRKRQAAEAEQRVLDHFTDMLSRFS